MALQVDLSRYQAPAQVGNVRLPAPGATTPRQVTPNAASSLNLGGIGRPQVGGITNQNLLPQNLRTQAPTSPNTSRSLTGFGEAPRPTTPPVSQVSGLGQYKGVTINPGTDKEIAEQLRQIDAGNPTMTERGSIVSADGSGNIVSPSNFKIDLSRPIESSALGSNLTRSDVRGARKSYEDYVLGLSEAMRYSPEYLRALESTQAGKLRGAELKSNFYTGNNLPGDTVGYAEGFTNRETALNDIRLLGAQQALQTQELIRQGNIEAAKALVQATTPQTVSPGTSLVSPFGDVAYGGTGAYSDYQAQQTYFNLAQSFPDALIPAYNTGLSAQQNLQIAQGLAAQSPSFQARATNVQQLAGGQVVAYNKNTGRYEVIQNAGDASSINASAASLKEAQEYADNVQRAINTADANFTVLSDIMRRAGINDAGSPIINQLNNRLQRKLIGNGDLAAFNSVLASVRAEYAQVLSRGGGVTDTVRREAEEIIPADISLAQLLKVKDAIHTEGQNVINAANAQVQAIQSRIAAPMGSGSEWDF